MRIVEYGKENSEVIMLLHGGGLSWWNYREEASLLKEKYHVVLPVLDGHAGSDVPFTTIEDNARALIDWIDKNCHGTVLIIGGLSLGGQILVEMLSQRSGICQHAIVESALAVPMRITAAWIAPAIGMSYGLIRQKWFSKMQFKALNIHTSLFEDYYRDTCRISKQDMIRFLKSNSTYRLKPSLADTTADAVILAGDKEQKAMLCSAEILHAAIPKSQLHILSRYGHGELSLNHPKEYVDILNQLLLCPRYNRDLSGNTRVF